MKHTLAALSLSALALGLLVPAAASTSAAVTSFPSAEGRWFADYDEAVRVAKEEGKDLFVDFTGSDWCGWCIRLHDEVFDHDEWTAGASDDFVFVALDFPRSEAAKKTVPNPGRNQELSAKFGVSGFPTILLMTADGDAYAKTGYQAGGPGKYVAHVKEIMGSGKSDLAKSQAVVPAFTAAEEGDAKWKAWDALVAAYAGMASSSSPTWSAMEAHVRWAMEADAENTSGKKATAVSALLEKGIVDDDIVAFILASDPKNELGLLEKVAAFKFNVVRDDASAKAAVAALREINALGFKDTALGFQLNLQAASWCAGPLADEAGKAEFAKKALEIGSDDEDMLNAVRQLLG